MVKTKDQPGFGDLCRRYIRLRKRYDTRQRNIKVQIAQLERQIEQLKAKRYGLKFPRLTEHVIRPIAEAILAEMPGYTFEVLGPFGLDHETSVHFYRKGVDEDQKYEGDNCKSITFIPSNREDSKNVLSIRDRSINTGRYPPNSMGAVNGMNHPSVEIPPDADVRWLMQHIR